MSSLAWCAFLVAAAIGAPARYLIDGLVQDRTESTLPWGTFLVNVSGCLVLGVISGLALYHDLGATAHTALGTGAMGAYTTFSTFTFETVRLAEEGAVDEAIRYTAASFVLGLIAASAGLALTAAL